MFSLTRRNFKQLLRILVPFLLLGGLFAYYTRTRPAAGTGKLSMDLRGVKPTQYYDLPPPTADLKPSKFYPRPSVAASKPADNDDVDQVQLPKTFAGQILAAKRAEESKMNAAAARE